MTAAVSIVVLLLGLPLLAFWLGGRRTWSRLGPGRGADPWGDWMRAHRLTAGEAAQVSSAVSRGRRLDDERLRAAAVDSARQALTGLAWRTATRAQRVLRVLLALWLVLQIATVLVALVTGNPDDVPWVTVVGLACGTAVVVVSRRRIRRSLGLNSEA